MGSIPNLSAFASDLTERSFKFPQIPIWSKIKKMLFRILPIEILKPDFPTLEARFMPIFRFPFTTRTHIL